MPSDAKKREQQRKKDAAKARQAGKKNQPKNEEKSQVNGASENVQNGIGQSEEGNLFL